MNKLNKRIREFAEENGLYIIVMIIIYIKEKRKWENISKKWAKDRSSL